jgi:two-component system response regulator
MIANAARTPIEMLLVEDSPTDVLLIEEAFAVSKVDNVLYTVKDGVEAIAFLRRQGKYHDAPRPSLVLLDLNLPKKDGRELLLEIKTDEDLKRIPVIILTTSDDHNDIVECYGRQANCYIVKPVDFNRFAEVVRDIEGFWFRIVTLPLQS